MWLPAVSADMVFCIRIRFCIPRLIHEVAVAGISLLPCLLACCRVLSISYIQRHCVGNVTSGCGYSYKEFPHSTSSIVSCNSRYLCDGRVFAALLPGWAGARRQQSADAVPASSLLAGENEYGTGQGADISIPNSLLLLSNVGV